MVILLAFLIGLGLMAGMCLLLGLPVMWLWNYAVVAATGANEIGYWQAVCLLLLSGLLVKSGGTSVTAKTK